ncbi:MAG: GWxTD domain-containing protein [Bacteroidota bacterium]
MFRIWTIVISGCLFAGCFTSNKLSNQVIQPYDHELYINYAIYNEFDASKMQLVFPQGDFTLKLNAYETPAEGEPLFSIEQEVKSKTEKEIEVFINVSEPEFYVDLEVLDIDSDRRYRNIEKVSKTINSSQQIRFEDVNGNLMLYNDVKKGEAVTVSHAAAEVKHLFVHYFPDTLSAARPPYSKFNYVFDPASGSSKSFTLLNGQAFIPEKEGLFFVRADTTAQGGKFLNCFQSDFPKLATAPRLIEAIRYITKNEEYQGLTTADDQKLALDEFWLERSGSKDRARTLIRTYYNRIRNANIFFTTCKEGWKTDQGMIYIIFGKPQKVNKSEDWEFWWYENNIDRPETGFFFDRLNDQMTLRRSADLELPWNVEIFDWRQGVIR